jgi:hypothetical protein
MKERARNVTASIQARLKNEAERQGRPFAEIIQYYAMESFLFRLSRTKYASKFILKGSLLFYVWNLPLRRPTKDMDFRGYVENSPENMMQVIKDILVEPVPEDGISFDLKSIKTEQTQIDADYQGMRIKFNGYSGRSRIPMQLDIGFSDEIISKAKLVDYPGLLSNQKNIQVISYPIESVISEKFHAMVYHAELNSRWKDYYDIWLISETFELDSSSIQKAIEKTFEKRETKLPKERPVALTVEFASKNETQWKSFLRRMNRENKDAHDFVNIVEKIWIYLEYPLQASRDKSKPDRHWTSQKGWK